MSAPLAINPVPTEQKGAGPARVVILASRPRGELQGQPDVEHGGVFAASSRVVAGRPLSGCLAALGRGARRSRGWWIAVAVGIAVGLFSAGQSRAESATWSGSADALWSTSLNWIPTAPPGFGDTATFDSAGNAHTTVDLGVGVTIQWIIFDTASAAAYTIGSGGAGAQILTLFSDGGVTSNAAVTAAERVNARIALGTVDGPGGFTFTNNSTANSLTIAGGISSATTDVKTLTVAGSGTTNISGAITDGAGSVALLKSGAGTLALSATSSYTGTTTLGGGLLRADSAAALGTDGNIIFAGGTLQYTSGSAGADWSTRIKNSTAAIRLDTNGQTVTLAGALDNTNTAGLTKVGQGTLVLSGANTHGGNTTVNAGTLQSGSSEVVPGAAVVSGNAAGVTATFDLNGHTESVGGLTLGGATATSGAAVATGVGTLILNGNVTYDAANSPLGATLSGNLSLGAATRIFAVNDSSTATDDLTISAAITGSGTAGLTKTGAGRLVLSGANSYPGSTLVSGGLLAFNGAPSIAGSGRSLTVNSAGAVALNYTPAATIQNDLLSRIVSTSAGTLALTANTNENLDFSAAGFGNNFTALFLGAAGNIAYSGTLTPNGTTYRLGGGGGTLTLGNPNALTGARFLVVNGSVVLPAANDITGTTTVNSGGTLQLGSGAAGQNGSVASASIVANGTLVFNNADPQSYGGAISGVGALTKNGAGALTLSAPQSYSGTTTVNSGALVLRGGDHTLAVGSPLVVNGGGTVDLGSNSQYVGPFSGAGGSVLGSGTLTTSGSVGTFAGSFGGSVNLVKVGIGVSNTLTLTGSNTTTGTISVLSGRMPRENANGGVGLSLKDGGVLASAGGITVSGNAALILDNTGTQHLADRVNDVAPITLNGGMIDYLGRASTSSAEALGAVTANGGLNFITSVYGAAGSAQLTLASLTRAKGALINVAASNTWNGGGTSFTSDKLGQPGTGYGRVLVTANLSGNLAPVNGVVPGMFNSGGVDNFSLVGYVANQGFGPLGTGGFPGTQNGLIGATGTSNVVNGGTVLAPMAINSYNQGALAFANGTVFGGDRLVLNSGMMIVNGNLGDPAARGCITSGTQELFIVRRDGGAGAVNAVHSVLQDNGQPVSVVFAGNLRYGNYGALSVTAANTYSGGTYVASQSGGHLVLDAADPGDVTIPYAAASSGANGLVIHSGSVVTMNVNQGQIDGRNSVTLNGDAVLNLVGQNTLAGLVFNSSGGVAAPKVVPYSTIVAATDYRNTAFGPKTGTLTITGNITATPGNPAVTPLIDSGTLDLAGSEAHEISVASLPQGNFVNSLTPLNGLQISSVITNGGFIKKGAGVLRLTGNNTFLGGLTVEQGMINVAAFNETAAAGPLGQGANAVVLGGSGGKTGGIEYAGGNAASTRSFTVAAGGVGVFQIDAAATVLTLGGPIDGGTGALIKSGPGTLTFSNSANTYGGPTTIAAGTLKLSAAAANNISSTSAIAISGGARLDVSTLTDGTLVLAQPLKAQGSGTAAVTGSINAGSRLVDLQDGANLGTLAISSRLTLGGGGTLKFDLGSTAGDRITSGAAASLAGTTTINLASLTTAGSLLVGNDVYTLLTAASGLDAAGAFALAAGSGTMDVSGTIYTLTLDAKPGALYLDVSASAINQWKGPGGGDWNVAGNWTAAVPNGNTATARLWANIAANAAVDLQGADQTVKTLSFKQGSPSGNYTLQASGAGKLHMAADSGAATIEVQSGAHSVTAPLLLDSNTDVVVSNPSDSLALSGTVSGTGALTLAAGSAGKVSLGGANFTTGHSGGTTVNAGTLQLDSADALRGGSNLTLSGAAKATLGGSSTVNLGSAVKLADLNLNAHATSGLTATLDLNKSKLVADKTQVSVATLRAQIKNAYAAARWTGSGITSAAAAADYAASAAAAKTAVGYLDNGIAAAQGGGKTTWSGRSVDSSSVLVRYTYYGDCNLDGQVNLTDFGIFKLNFGTGSQWYQGDFDYGGTVNLADFGKFKQAFGSPQITAGAAVPEPSIIILLVTGGAAVGFRLLRRSRK